MSLGTAPFGITPFGGVVAELSDWQFELGGMTFGYGLPLAVSRFEKSGSEVRDQDVPAVAGDWRVFGRDRKTPGVWSWDLFTDMQNATGALAVLDQAEAVWDGELYRSRPQLVQPLRYRLAGRTRRVFGRPRRFTAVPTTLAEQGRIDAVADFALAEPWSYDDTEQSLRLTTAATVLGTPTTFPLSFPFLWGASAGSPRHGQITVGGTRPTWLRVTFTGPVGTTLTDPYVIVGEEVFQLRGVVLPEEQIVVSSLPWEQGVFRGDGTTSSVTLDPTARLSQLRVAPGTHTVSFGGIDNTGTATCTVAWRDAYTSI